MNKNQGTHTSFVTETDGETLVDVFSLVTNEEPCNTPISGFLFIVGACWGLPGTDLRYLDFTKNDEESQGHVCINNFAVSGHVYLNHSI